MLHKILRAAGALLSFVVAAIGCWYLVLWVNWPTWGVGVLLALIVFGVFAAVFTRRRWVAWRIRRRLAVGMVTSSDREAVRALDRAWRAGFNRLRQLRQRRAGGALYALPWFLMLGATGAGKSTLLTRTRLASTLRPVRQDEPVAGTAVLDWWYFDRSVVIDPAGRLIERDSSNGGNAEWTRLLHWLGRSRRREPLNGIVLALSVAELRSATAQRLAETGRLARARIDALTSLYCARIPVYIVLTHAECIEGFAGWTSGLPQALREQPFGMTLTGGEGTEAFVDGAFARIVTRLADIRVEQRMREDSAAVFLLPERIQALSTALKAYLHPAFDFNPYGETPLLSGVFFTAEVNGESGAPRGWFSRELFDVLLPGRRDAFVPTGRFGHWQRLLRHAAVAGWLGACILVGGAMTWGFLYDRATLQHLAGDPPQRITFAGPFAVRLGALSRYAKTLATVGRRADGAILDWLPFHRHVRRVEAALGQTYCEDFRREALNTGSDPMLDSRIQAVARGDNDTLVAAYAQHLVRRINLLDAALARRSLDGLPQLGADMVAIEADAQPGAALDPLMTSRFGALYNTYLHWQRKRGVLADERAHMVNLLDTLALPSRRVGWLLAWADLQGDLAPVTLAQFWGIRDRSDLPRISAAYTPDGHAAIRRFIGEIQRTKQYDAIWKNGTMGLDGQYRRALTNAWYAFMTAFVQAPTLLRGEDDWRSSMAGMLGAQNPYQQLLHEIARTFTDLPHDGDTVTLDVPSWVDTARRLDRLQRAVYDGSRSTTSKMIDTLRLSNDVSRAAVQQPGGPVQQISAMRDDFALAQRLGQFRDELYGIGNEIAKGDGHAFKLAANAYAFSATADLKTTPLVAAAGTFEQLSAPGVTRAPADLPVWNLVRGPLDFTMQYVSRVVASTLQKSWDAQVLAPLQGVSDPIHTMQLVYAEKGLVPAFMDGPVQAFVERRTDSYAPRELWGQRVPLNGLFYAFVSRAQREKNNLADTAQRDAAQEKADDEARAARGREREDIGRQLQQLQAQIAALRAVSSVVTLSASPPDVNAGARAVPQKTSLSLQCTAGKTVLENLNFPTSATFAWSYATCGETVLTIEFPDMTLTHQWSGPTGFIEFLRTFRDGRHTFGAEDFPASRKAMAASNLQTVTLTFTQQGEVILLSSFAEADRLSSQSDALRARQAMLAAVDEQATQPLPGMPAQAAFDLSVPMRIADPWNEAAANTSPLTTAPASAAAPALAAPAGVVGSGAARAQTTHQYAVRVGLFAQPAHVNQTLREMDISYENRPVTRASDTVDYLVLATGFADRAAAQQAADKIGKQLKVSPLVVADNGA
ncbi:type VI secretion protein IcmF/TssM N-terminal domain-containing protein [Paraburkholderia agricolaris]|uniref:type VI secretion protein IcmF/TssM N-terminal domain-containing protein n=1 Tax=Paraburkholderia agricolaris TaxID=2152888 RepID=UPI0038BC8545